MVVANGKGWRARGRVWGVAGMMAVAGLALGGCTGEEAVAQDPRGAAYAAEFEQARGELEDPALLAMLDDGWITDEEMATALDMTLQCLRDQGLDVKAEESYTLSLEYKIGAFTEQEVEAIRAPCMEGFYDPINSLYAIPRENPGNEDADLLLMECLKRVGELPADLTLDQYKADRPTMPEGGGSVHWEGCFADVLNYGR